MPRRPGHRLGRPAPKEPTQQQKALIELVVQEGGPVAVLGPQAGYKDSPGGHRAAREALKLPWCQAWLMKRVREELSQDAAAARLEVIRLATGAKSEYVRFQAASYLLDRVEKLTGNNPAAQGLSININLGSTPPKKPADIELDVDDDVIDITPPGPIDRACPDTEPSRECAETRALPPPGTPDRTDNEDLPSSTEADPGS